MLKGKCEYQFSLPLGVVAEVVFYMVFFFFFLLERSESEYGDEKSLKLFVLSSLLNIHHLLTPPCSQNLS